MPDIVLTTLNAKFAHASFGLRYLFANLGPLQDRAAILEFDINQRPVDMLEALLARNPRIVGIGVYIWNTMQVAQLVGDLKRLRPDITVILGGPEVSYETEQQELTRLADYVITGEADLAFAELCQKLLAGEKPLQKIIAATLPQLEDVALPYPFYDQRDIEHRVVYVEASRGCPFKCEFCLSSLDIPVRNVPLEPFLAQMQDLIDRGLRQFKFVDRTFNLNITIGKRILAFFLDAIVRVPNLFLHFEMIPDRLPEPLRELIRRFPPGALQFEVGIQTFDEDVMQLISRKQDNAKLEDNLRFLREETGVHVHADLIVGLPGEDVDGFGRGFDRLVALKPQEIQVGMLKRLRGTPIIRHDAAWEMKYSPTPPYEVLQTKLIDFATMQRMRRFAKYWDIVANSGNFVKTTPLLWGDKDSPFAAFLRFSDWLYERVGRQHGIALTNLTEYLFRYLVDELHADAQATARVIWDDYQRTGRSDVPPFLRPHLPEELRTVDRRLVAAPKRQARHMA
jgi:radical SAM superfamily enzyme YgiQ (UPF0313 family)